MALSVVFDMDGVLLDSERIYARAWRQAGAARGLSGLEDIIRRCVGRNGTDICALLQSEYGAGFEAAAFALEVRNIFLDIAAAEGLPTKPGVTELLPWLRGRGAKIALATSSSQSSADRNLSEAGLSHFFDAVVTGDMVASGKPAPDIYLLACRRLGVSPEQCFAVEDSPNGLLSAHSAGLKVLLVPDIAEVPPDREKLALKTFVSLREVREFLESYENFSASQTQTS